ncbi:methyl-accepting chemotaxis protein [Vibrio quintilis]|uniref:Methyl-accepting chemotaxis protein McpS n=1 Tax=Vibrio quintilis TaxID=1117707 RepID=A0A1M7YX41_9VIBR|nr:methyl-accepting chemotaxis protein [Vibrio quintilis]SHO57083.1 Methyl-accepting chemotaxis protein McpS [Vibrio quintilis]
MFNISIKYRLYILSFIPLLLIVVSMMMITGMKISELNAMQMQAVRTQMVQAKENELQSYVQLANSALTRLKQRSATREEAIQELSTIKFGHNGYMFGYDSQGTRLFLGSSSKGIGQNFWDARDAKNNLFIRDIVNNGKKSGGGFARYYFPKPGETEPAEKLSFTVYEPQWDMVIGTGFYIDDVEQTINSMDKRSAQATKEGFTAIMMMCGMVVIVAAFIAFFISRSILVPLRQFDTSIASFAGGHADLTARMDTFRIPEFSVLSQNFNTFVANLQSIVKNVTDVSGTISDETKHMTSRANEADTLAVAQREETEQVATAITEMTTTAHEISQNAMNAAQSAQTADDRAKDAMGTVSSAVDSVQILATQIDQASQVITRLEGNVHQISSSLEVIQDIAEQTNLLALNAAIEAARAGAQGRGFAVVADEVRKLAGKTQQSTGSITDVLNQLRSATEEAVQAMQMSVSQSDTSVSQANAAGKALEDIVQAIGTIMDMNALIATATEEQSQVGQDISERVTTISDQSHHSADIANDNRQISNTLNTQAGELIGLVNQFEV